MKISDEHQAIVWAITSSFWISVMLVFVRYLSTDYHAFQIVFMRNLLAIFFFVPWIVKEGLPALHTTRIKLHIWRSAIGVIAMLSWFYAISKMPLPEATALSFTAPIFSTIAAILYLKEKVHIEKWLAIFSGFLGALIIIRPGFIAVNHAAYIVLFSTSLWAIAAIVIKNLTKTEYPKLITFYMTIFMTPFALPFAIAYWQPVIMSDLIFFAIIGLTSNLAHIALSKSYSKADISVLMPYDFLRLLFISIMAYVAFGDIVDIWTIAGGAVIIGSTAYITRRETLRKRRLLSLIAEEKP
jgi:drug/metabolite transporter (DMT)-like permease